MRTFLIVGAAAALAVAGRSATDRTDISAWQATGPDTFRYTVPAPGLADWAWGEGYRERWLAKWLEENRFCPRGFDIVSRTPLKATSLGDREVWQGRCTS